MSELEGRVAIVTGVTSGVGRGMARVLARRGVKVVGTGRRTERGEQLANEVRAEGGDLSFVTGDISAVADCDRVVAETLGHHGRLDILVNNAAAVTDPPMCDSHELSETQWDTVFDTNLKGTFFCTRAALTPMLEQGSGCIVNIASVVGLNIGPPRMAAYTTSKAGIIALTKTLAVEYADRGIRMNAIVLGGAEGESAYRLQDQMGRAALGDRYEAQPYEERDSGRMTGEDLAETVAFLCGNAARHIVGAAIPVDSGAAAGLYLARAMEAANSRR